MHKIKDIENIGVGHHRVERRCFVDLWEDLNPWKYVISYNSYAIMDEKIAVMDSMKLRYRNEWLENLHRVLNGRQPDYLVVQHMERDHSANISAFMEAYPQAVVVASAKAFAMMKDFFDQDYQERRLVVKEGDQLELGKHTLTFFAPTVRSPEVIVTYDSYAKALFSADVFDTSSALDVQQDWQDWRDCVRIGEHGEYVCELLQKTDALDIQAICPLSGPVLSENVTDFLSLYQVIF